MALRIEYARLAERTLRRLDAKLRRRVIERLEAIAATPDLPHPEVKRLEGRPELRLRVGDWRVIYVVDRQRAILHVLAVGPRGEIYGKKYQH